MKRFEVLLFNEETGEFRKTQIEARSEYWARFDAVDKADRSSLDGDWEALRATEVDPEKV